MEQKSQYIGDRLLQNWLQNINNNKIMMNEANIHNQQHSRNGKVTAFRFGSIKRNNKILQLQKVPHMRQQITGIKTNIDIGSQHIQIIASPTSSHAGSKIRNGNDVDELPIKTKMSNEKKFEYKENMGRENRPKNQTVRRGTQQQKYEEQKQEDEENQFREINRHFNNEFQDEDGEFMDGQEIQFVGFRHNGINNNKNNIKSREYDDQYRGIQIHTNAQHRDKQNINHYLLSQNTHKQQLKNNFIESSSSRASPKMSKKYLQPQYLASNPSEHQQSGQQPLRSHPTKYGPGGIQTLQFNPQKQKLIILDSKETQTFPVALPSFCEQIQFPKLSQLPQQQQNADKLVEIGKQIFYRFGCEITDQTVINVRKYKNCVHFNISNEDNILYHFENGKLYYGGWRGHGEGEKYGEGLEILPGKYKFKGFFMDGKKSGQGTLINWDGSAYVGQWENGFKSGVGRQLDSDGIIYEGQWKDGKKSGYGKLYNNGRLQFEGVFQKGLKNGYGKQYFQNGDLYDGNYQNHKFQGKGTYSWKTGATYTGDFKEGKRNGYGVWKSAGNNYDLYEGEYLNDKKHGKGVYRWSNGAVYEGYFKDDLKNGQGTIIYENGKVAHLTWKNGKAQKKLQKPKQKPNQQQEQQQIHSYRNHQLSQRKLPSRGTAIAAQHNQQPKSQTKTTFVLGNRPTSRSTQNLQSAHSASTLNSHSHRNSFKGITFNTRPVNKLLSKVAESKVEPKIETRPQKDQVIRLRFDNRQFEKALGKNWDKNYLNSGHEAKKNLEIERRPELPKDRPYQGIQSSSNINMDL